MKNYLTPSLAVFVAALCACSHKLNSGSYSGSAKTSGYQADSLAQPLATKSVKNFSKVVGWSGGSMPTAPAGFIVTKYADGLEHPRWIYVAENGDVFVAESNTLLRGINKIGSRLSRKIKTQHYGVSANRILLFRNEGKGDTPPKPTVFIDHELNQPFGMLILGDHFYVSNTNGLMEYDYTAGQTHIDGKGKLILSLPAGKNNRHWTRNIITNAARNKIYIGVGSGTNVAEKGLSNEVRRANILEVNPDGSGERIYASGLRNPVGMAWAPGTHTLWAAVNERDELGDELVPDYLTGVRENGFYGWPYYYYGDHPDPRISNLNDPDLEKKVIVPDVALGSHTASLGLVFYQGKSFPSKYHDGAFITQHGSWNRSIFSGYKVVFVPFKDGRPDGKPEDFLSGFIDQVDKSEVHGRPVGIAVLPDGSMLVSDDVSNTIWRVSANK